MEVKALDKVLDEQEVTWEVVDKTEALDIILAGCKKNNAACQEKLYKKFYGYAFSIALKYCYRREDAMETVNDSFVKVFKKLDTFNFNNPFKPWFRTIVVNSAIDKTRATKKFANHMDIKDAYTIESPVNVISDLNAEQVLDLLNQLPPINRFVFSMFEMDGYSHQEIAHLLEIPESSSRTYLFRAKAKLRLLYKKHYLD